MDRMSSITTSSKGILRSFLQSIRGICLNLRFSSTLSLFQQLNALRSFLKLTSKHQINSIQKRETLTIFALHQFKACNLKELNRMPAWFNHGRCKFTCATHQTSSQATQIVLLRRRSKPLAKPSQCRFIRFLRKWTSRNTTNL